MVYILEFTHYNVNGDYTHKGENKTDVFLIRIVIVEIYCFINLVDV